MTPRLPSAGPLECRSCGTRFDEGTWIALPLSCRIDAEEIAKFVLGWSARDFVEVRVCAVCAAQVVARRRRRAA